MSRKFKVGLVGATGLVGEEFCQIIAARKNWQVEEFRPFASERSLGSTISLHGKKWTVKELSQDCFKGLDFVFFSSGDDISKEWAPKAVEQGAFAIDNSSAFRMDASIPLIVPEVNGDILEELSSPCIIANPNCSTIQLVVALAPLQKEFGLEQVVVSTYQAVSGGGKVAQQELAQQIQAWAQKESPKPEVFPRPIHLNCIPQIGQFDAEGECSEETKIRLETKKILRLPRLKVSAFTVRIPVWNVHSESVWVRLPQEVPFDRVSRALKMGSGVRLTEDSYVTPRELESSDEVFVSRLHRDVDDPRSYLFWVVADNLRKGAALNGLQIAERLFDKA